MLKLIYKALNAKPEEYNQVLLLLGYGFFMGVFLATFQISAETLFVTKLGEGYIRWGIFAAGFTGVITTALFAFMQNKAVVITPVNPAANIPHLIYPSPSFVTKSVSAEI